MTNLETVFNIMFKIKKICINNENNTNLEALEADGNFLVFLFNELEKNYEALSKKNQKDLKDLKDELFFNAKMIFKGYF